MNLCGLGTLSSPEEQWPYHWLLLTVGGPSSHNSSLFFPRPLCQHIRSHLLSSKFSTQWKKKSAVCHKVISFLPKQNINIVLGIFWKVCLNKVKKICSGEQIFRQIEEGNILEHGSTLCQVGAEASVPMVVGLCSNSPSLSNATPDAAL